jgi:hypothetical protein
MSNLPLHVSLLPPAIRIHDDPAEPSAVQNPPPCRTLGLPAQPLGPANSLRPADLRPWRPPVLETAGPADSPGALRTTALRSPGAADQQLDGMPQQPLRSASLALRTARHCCGTQRWRCGTPRWGCRTPRHRCGTPRWRSGTPRWRSGPARTVAERFGAVAERLGGAERPCLLPASAPTHAPHRGRCQPRTRTGASPELELAPAPSPAPVAGRVRRRWQAGGGGGRPGGASSRSSAAPVAGRGRGWVSGGRCLGPGRSR